jgi:hypothetical protein
MRRIRFVVPFLALCALSFAFNVYGGIVLPPSDNLLENSQFNSGLGGWEVNLSQTAWTSSDVNGSVSSGSALITDSGLNGGTEVIQQCFSLSPGAGPFDVGARFFIPSGQGQRAYGLTFLDWFSDSSCSGGSTHSDHFITPVPTPTDSWALVAGYQILPPSGAFSVEVGFGIGKFDNPSGPTVAGYVDGTFFRLTSCTPAVADLCLHGGRFRVTTSWESPTDGGFGSGVQFNDDSGYFYFFSANNTEVVVKTVSACVPPFNRYWVFAAGLTNVLVTLNVEDTFTGFVNHYINPGGTAFEAIQDTDAFDTCP